MFLGSTLETLKADLMDTKSEILKCMSDNIEDQNDVDSLAALMSLFNLASTEDLESRLEKISKLYNIYGIDTEKTMEKWYINNF